jgi:hypothetical protein
MARGNSSHPIGTVAPLPRASRRYSDEGVLPLTFQKTGRNNARADPVVWETVPRERAKPRVLSVAMLVAASGLLGYAAGGGAPQLIEAANSRVLRMMEGQGEHKTLARMSLPPIATIESATPAPTDPGAAPATESPADFGPLAGKSPPRPEPFERASLAAAAPVVPPQSSDPEATPVPETPTPSPAAPAFSPTRTFIPRSQIRAVQEALANLGFDPGPIDGSVGRGTRRAISEYQRWQGLAETGELTAEVVAQLAPNYADPPPTRYRTRLENQATTAPRWISRDYDYPDRER